MKDEYSDGPTNSHLNSAFSQRVAPLLAQQIVDILEDSGDTGSMTGGA
jgi:hypothetical protein